MSKVFNLMMFCSLALGCGRESQTASSPTVEEGGSPQSHCVPRDEPIHTIAGVVALVNSLPKPVTLDCVVASLKRPLFLNATSSVISAQPATSRDKPRIFLQNAGLFLSVVPGDATLEFGETWQSLYSIKGELTFPIRETLSDNAPFVTIGPILKDSPQQTRCGGPCHGTTLEYSNQGGVTVFASQIVRPNPTMAVPLNELKAAWKNCGLPDDPACELYLALFEEGDPQEFEFSEEFPFF